MLTHVKKLFVHRPGKADFALLVVLLAFGIPSLAFAASAPPFLTGLKDSFFEVLRVLLLGIVGWIAIGMLKNKAYGQFIGFLVFSLIIYVIIFTPAVFTTIGNQVGETVKTSVGP